MSRDFFFDVAVWWRWAVQAASWRRTHPPHLFCLFEGAQRGEEQPDIEALRAGLRSDATPLEAPDAGEGSRAYRKGRTVRSVARTALKSPREARVLAQLARGLQAERVLELGTCLGLTTAYLARTGAHVTTIEADPLLAEKARSSWEALGVQDTITQYVGTFAEVLPELERTWLADRHPGFDLIFIDGHHHGPALRAYVAQLRPWLRKRELPAAVVCDDIRWSPSMWAAWQEFEADWPVAVDLGGSGWLLQGPRLTPFHKAVRL